MSFDGPCGESNSPPASVLPPLHGEVPTIPGAPPEPITDHSSSPPSDAAQPPRSEPARPLFVVVANEPSARCHWWVTRLRETPAWLTSMVIHLTAAILIASLRMPVSQPGTAVIVLEMLGTESTGAAIPITFVPTDVPLSPLPEAPSKDRTQGTETESTLAESLLADALPKIDEKNRTSPADSGRHQGVEPDDSPPITNAMHGEASISGLQVVLDARPKSTSPSGQRIIWGHDPFNADDIVGRFIQYDIGELRGEAGNRARREFEQLGPQSIPALVRGLNQSARIQASCPVGVITRKLQETITRTRDRSLIDFALANIGKDVPLDAPHFRRIHELRESLFRQFADRQLAANLATVRHMNPGNGSWLDRVAGLYRATADELVQSATDSDRNERSVVWAVLAMREHPEILPADKVRLARILLEQLSRERPVDRRHVHAALHSLALNSGLPTSPPAFHERSTNEVLLNWQDWWNEYESVDRDAIAANMLRNTQFMNRSAATEVFKRIIVQFPGTPAAQFAQSNLPLEPKLQLATEFEKRWRIPDAIQLYDEITQQHPTSPASSWANGRLNELRAEPRNSGP